MSTTAVIVRTEEQEQDFAMSVALKSMEVFMERFGLHVKDNERRLLDNLVEERFPDYFKTRYRMDKIKKAVDEGRVGGFDRDGNRICSYNELKKYLFNK
jgi:hypothetical protein